MLAVLPGYQERGIGGRLKWAQREDALRAGVSLITWTYDPLQARNANLNLHRLGATAMEFLEDFYGVTSSSLHHRLPTDRLLVYWNLRSPRVAALAEKRETNLRAPAPDAAAHQRGEVAGGLAGVVRADRSTSTRPSCCSRSRRTGTSSPPPPRGSPRDGSRGSSAPSRPTWGAGTSAPTSR